MQDMAVLLGVPIAIIFCCWGCCCCAREDDPEVHAARLVRALEAKHAKQLPSPVPMPPPEIQTSSPASSLVASPAKSSFSPPPGMGLSRRATFEVKSSPCCQRVLASADEQVLASAMSMVSAAASSPGSPPLAQHQGGGASLL